MQVALQQPFLRLSSQELDHLLRGWYDARELVAKGHSWRDARWLAKLGPGRVELVADAAAWVFAGSEAPASEGTTTTAIP